MKLPLARAPGAPRAVGEDTLSRVDIEQLAYQEYAPCAGKCHRLLISVSVWKSPCTSRIG